jgi:hypothetical protein
MTDSSEFKDIVRARMTLTGEKYTAAQRAVLAMARAAAQPPVRPERYEDYVLRRALAEDPDLADTSVLVYWRFDTPPNAVVRISAEVWRQALTDEDRDRLVAESVEDHLSTRSTYAALAGEALADGWASYSVLAGPGGPENG